MKTNKALKLLDKIDAEKTSIPILAISAIGIIISIIGLLPILIFKNFLIFQFGIFLIGIGIILLITLTIIGCILLVIDMLYCIFEDMKNKKA